VICVLAVTSSIAQISTPPASPMATINQQFGIGEVTIEYSRPSKKGRDIFGVNSLVPYDKIWRTGANRATKITFSDDVMVEGAELSAGTYAVLSIPGKMEWSVMFYEHSSGNWGSYVEAKPAATVMVKPVKLQMSFETFTVIFGNLSSNSATMGMMWDDTYVPISISTEVDAKVMASIDKTLAGPTNADYYAAGVYYLETGKDLDKALEFVQKQTKSGEPRFWQLRQESLILAKLGRYKEALNVAKKSLELATTAGNDDYVKMNTDSIAMWAKK